MKKLDTKKKKTESEIISDLLKITADAEHNLSMIGSVSDCGIDLARQSMNDGEYESAYFNLGEVVHFDYLRKNLQEIKKILEEKITIQIGYANFVINSNSRPDKKKPPEELN